jgi:hypothetical protein
MEQAFFILIDDFFSSVHSSSPVNQFPQRGNVSEQLMKGSDQGKEALRNKDGVVSFSSAS